MHTSIERTGRGLLLPKVDGAAAQVFDTTGYSEVARLTSTSSGLGGTPRLSRYLARRAQLVGCDAVGPLVVDGAGTGTASCLLRERASAPSVAPGLVLPESESLASALELAGDEAPAERALLAVLSERTQEERYWAVQWYLEKYPASPWRAHFEALLLPKGTSSSARHRSMTAAFVR